MAYTDDAVKAKLSSLNETQESIVSVSQWIMFHRRHADRTCTIWLERMRETTVSKRLTLIYLANEVVQQSKARRKEDFLVSFSPVIAEATATAYRGATNDVQEKIRRTVEVWSQRRIFEKTIQEAVEARILELDKSRSGKKGGLLGGSLFSSGNSSSSSSGSSAAPAEIQPLIPLQTAISKATATSTPAIATATSEYEKLNDPEKPTPSPPVHAARLSALLKSLSSAESAVAESIKTRSALIDGLEKLLADTRKSLEDDRAQLLTTQNQRESIEKRKREVEDAIMRGNTAATAAAGGDASSPPAEPHHHVNGRAPAEPEPPRFESLTPPPLPSDDLISLNHSTEATDRDHDSLPQPPPQSSTTAPYLPPANISHSPLDPRQQYRPSSSSTNNNNNGSVAKKRKLDAEFTGFGTGGEEEDVMADLDDDVAELLRAESGGGGVA
ncbi:MAG: hypothetical protein Q9220_006656 [cf. Caloplaca sp. 1 TL-2023]